MKNLISIIIIVVLYGQSLAQTGNDAALNTIGASSGLLLYNTYLTIGSTSDAYVGECYKGDLVKTILNEQIASIEAVSESYTSLLSSGFLTDAGDKSFVGDIVVTLGYLKNQAKSLNDYVDSGSTSDSDKYEYNRNEAWKKISKLLDLEEKSE